MFLNLHVLILFIFSFKCYCIISLYSIDHAILDSSKCLNKCGIDNKESCGSPAGSDTLAVSVYLIQENPTTADVPVTSMETTTS
jgi:hypothetical protein